MSQPPATAPRVTVLLPVYNGAAYLREALDSIRAQTFRDWELLIVDDASVDDSRRIAEDYAHRDARIKLLANAQNKGVAGALNTGKKAARGVYVARMDADDISLPERLEKQVAYLEAHPEVTVCGTWVRLLGERAGTQWSLPTDWDTIRCTLLFHNALAHPTVMWRHAGFLRHGWRYFRQNPAQDYELWVRIAETARIVNLPEVLLLYRVHAQSVTRSLHQSFHIDDRDIYLRQLQRMDLVPTAAELDLHGRLSRPEIAPTQAFAQQATVWMDKLLAANERSGFLPKTAFAQLIAQKKRSLRAALLWGRLLSLAGPTLTGKAKAGLERLLPRSRVDRLVECAQQGLLATLGRRQRDDQPGTTPTAAVAAPPAGAGVETGPTPLVSILMPMFNAEAYLRAAIESMLAQTYRTFEFLIVDDQSTDGSRRIAEEYAQRDARIKVIANTGHKGVTGALNFGLDAAAGVYVARMDADDISLPTRLEKQVAYLEAHPEVTVCGTWVRLLGEHAGKEWKLATDWDTIRCTMFFYGAVAHPTVMWRRADFLRQGWRYDEQYRAEDYELWTRIAETARIVNLPEVLFLYRVHAHSVTQAHAPRFPADNRRIHLRQLQRLGLVPSTEELDLHEALGSWRLQATGEFARRANAWLDKLLAANRATGFLPDGAWACFLAEKRKDIRAALSWRAALQCGPDTAISKAAACSRGTPPKKVVDRLACCAVRGWQFARTVSARGRRVAEILRNLLGLGYPLQKTLPPKFKIGMAVLAHERPDYLELCLDSLFKTDLHDYDITFLIVDDGSTDPRVREIINRPRDPRYKIVRAFTPKGPNNAGAAINKAVRRLLELDDFAIIGWCDPDALFHPAWLDMTLKICLWAKQHHKLHVLGPFSSFNSSDHSYHRVLGTFRSPYGSFLVKRQMGMLNYFYFKADFLKLGFFPENPDEETQMTERFDKLGVRNVCTATSYVEHLGQESVLNQWRPVPVRRAVHGRQLAPTGWDYDLERLSPYAYYRYLKKNATFGPGLTPSAWPLDVLMPVIRKDLATLPLAVAGLRKNLRHPLGQIILVSPPDELIQGFCRRHHCAWRDENSVLPIRKSDIHYEINGLNRAGWIFQQLLKLSADRISEAEHILLFDADTILLQPQRFEQAGRSLLLIADEYHWPYFATHQKLFGAPPADRFSMIAHQMLVSRQRLAGLRAELEQRHQRPWYQAIVDALDTWEPSSFSEFETYGHWMLQNHRAEVELEYWFNLALPRRRLGRWAGDARRWSRDFRSLSYQDYHV